MSEKRMLIVDVEVMRKIDENRGDLSISEFFNLLIDKQLKEENTKHNGVSREEFYQFQQGMKDLLHSFLEFFVTYGLELGEQTGDEEFLQLSKRLRTLGGSVSSKRD
jgi:hypothetical protein